jgi:1,4-dihydroxy-2-naphthoate octaprenyltransferase/chlorophyll synthase
MTASTAGHAVPKSSLARWTYALKPASWPKLLVPALFGQALGATAERGFDTLALGWGLAFTSFGLAFIVLLNDWGDRRVDAIKRQMFPEGCSPKTIPDGILSAPAVGFAGVVLGCAALLVAAGAQRSLGRPFALPAGLGCMLIFVAYTLPPLRLNYRGGGEILEMLGVGIALPSYNAYLQAGGVSVTSWPWIAGFALLSLASAAASGLSDEQSDRIGGKRTLASTFGNAAARRLSETCVILGASVWLGASLLAPSWVSPWASIPALIILAWNFVRLRKVSDEAVTNAFRAQGAYKLHLHRAIWHSTTVAALVLWLQPSFQ